MFNSSNLTLNSDVSVSLTFTVGSFDQYLYGNVVVNRCFHLRKVESISFDRQTLDGSVVIFLASVCVSVRPSVCVCKAHSDDVKHVQTTCHAQEP